MPPLSRSPWRLRTLLLLSTLLFILSLVPTAFAGCTECCMNGQCAEAYHGRQGVCCGMRGSAGLARPYCCPYPSTRCAAFGSAFRCEVLASRRRDRSSPDASVQRSRAFDPVSLIWIFAIVFTTLICCCALMRRCAAARQSRRAAAAAGMAGAAAAARGGRGWFGRPPAPPPPPAHGPPPPAAGGGLGARFGPLLSFLRPSRPPPGPAHLQQQQGRGAGGPVGSSVPLSAPSSALAAAAAARSRAAAAASDAGVRGSDRPRVPISPQTPHFPADSAGFHLGNPTPTPPPPPGPPPLEEGQGQGLPPPSHPPPPYQRAGSVDEGGGRALKQQGVQGQEGRFVPSPYPPRSGSSTVGAAPKAGEEQGQERQPDEEPGSGGEVGGVAVSAAQRKAWAAMAAKQREQQRRNRQQDQ